MFGNSRMMLAAVTVLVILVTYAVAYNCVSALTNEFYYVIGGLLLSEAFAGFVGVELCKTDRKAMPFILGNGLIAAGYILFALIMFIPFACGASENALRLWEIVGLLCAVICHVFLGIAHRSTVDATSAQERSMMDKKIFAAELERFKLEHADMCAADAEVAAKTASLAEAIRFSSESTPASTEINEKIFELFQQLHEAATAEMALEIIKKLNSQIAYRNQIIKINR